MFVHLLVLTNIGLILQTFGQQVDILQDLDSQFKQKNDFFKNNFHQWANDFTTVKNNYKRETEEKLNSQLQKFVERIDISSSRCDELVNQTLTTIRESANSYIGCSDFTENRVLRYLSEIDKQIQQSKKPFELKKMNYKNCKNDENCLEQNVTELQEAISNLQKSIDMASSFVQASKSLNFCDTIKEFTEKGKELISAVRRECST